jgi:predicted nucleic acid-binding protein
VATLFLDTSSLARRYFPSERGARRVRAVCAPSLGHALFQARIAAVEFAAALNRRVRDGTLPVQERNRHWQAFQIHLRDQYRVIQATEAVYASAQHLVFTYALRSLDALQLASALAVRARLRRSQLQFWTADEQQAAAARGEGLTVELL